MDRRTDTRFSVRTNPAARVEIRDAVIIESRDDTGVWVISGRLPVLHDVVDLSEDGGATGAAAVVTDIRPFVSGGEVRARVRLKLVVKA